MIRRTANTDTAVSSYCESTWTAPEGVRYSGVTYCCRLDSGHEGSHAYWDREEVVEWGEGEADIKACGELIHVAGVLHQCQRGDGHAGLTHEVRLHEADYDQRLFQVTWQA
jgi:hypothetical protein